MSIDTLDRDSSYSHSNKFITIITRRVHLRAQVGSFYQDTQLQRNYKIDGVGTVHSLWPGMSDH